MENGWHYTRADAIRALREIREVLKNWLDLTPQIEQGMEDEDVSYVLCELEQSMLEIVQYIDKKNEILICAATQAMRYGIEDGAQLGLLQEIKAELERAEAKLKEAGMPEAITLGSTADIVREAHQYCTDALQYNLCKPTDSAPKSDRVWTPRARAYFQRAQQEGYIEQDGEQLHWNGSNVSLHYFLTKVYRTRGGGEVPYKALKQLFGVDVSKSYLDPDRRQPWMKEIDKLFVG